MRERDMNESFGNNRTSEGKVNLVYFCTEFLWNCEVSCKGSIQMEASQNAVCESSLSSISTFKHKKRVMCWDITLRLNYERIVKKTVLIIHNYKK